MTDALAVAGALALALWVLGVPFGVMTAMAALGGEPRQSGLARRLLVSLVVGTLWPAVALSAMIGYIMDRIGEDGE